MLNRLTKRNLRDKEKDDIDRQCERVQKEKRVDTDGGS